MNIPIERNGRLSTNVRRGIKHNLTGNKYGRYIPREELESEIVEFLQNEDTNYLIVSGLGGIGKSSLIYSVLSKIINGDIEFEKPIDSIIWVTDSYNPGDLDIDKLVDEINAVYGDSASTQVFTGSNVEKKDAAKKHLHLSQGVLSILVVDNYETVADESLRRFIFELPQTCKVILTSKINRDACIRTNVIKVQNEWCIKDLPVPTFSKEEWNELFNSICQSVSYVSRWAERFKEAELAGIIETIHTELGGIPFPFERILLQISERNITDVLKVKKLIGTIVNGSGGYERMIAYSWDKLSRNSRAVLIAASLGGYLSTLNFSQLSFVSGLEACDDEYSAEIESDLDHAIKQCLDVKLMEIDMSKGHAEHYVPSTVYRYVINKVLNDRDVKTEYSDVITNWIEYYKNRTKDIGMCFDNTEKMLAFDSVNQREALEFVLDYCYSNGLYAEHVYISNNMRYFFYTRSIWEVGDKCIHIKRAIAANKCGDYLSELEAYVYYINIAAKYRQLDEIPMYLDKAKQIVDVYKIQESKPEVFFRYSHALGLYYYHSGEYDQARELWERLLHEPIMTSNIHDIDAATRWYTKCLVEHSPTEGEESNLLVKINELLTIARKHHFERAIIDYTLMLVKIYVQQHKESMLKTLLYSNEIVVLIDKTNDILYKVKYYLWCAFDSNGIEREKNIEQAKKLANVATIRSVIKKEMGSLFEEFYSALE